MSFFSRAISLPEQLFRQVYLATKATPKYIIILTFVALAVTAFSFLYAFLHIIAPKPRLPFSSEKQYVTIGSDGRRTIRRLPCWYDRWLAERRELERRNKDKRPQHFDNADTALIEPAEVAMSVVVPAYNEEKRIEIMLEEAVEYLDTIFGRPPAVSPSEASPGAPGPSAAANSSSSSRPSSSSGPSNKRPTPHRHIHMLNKPRGTISGYEIIIINDGSKDRTVDVALNFCAKHQLHDILRVVTLDRNRGKGGSVTHGLRHVRGEYAVFADADGASRFSDLGKLLEGLEEVVDGSYRGVAIGSRAHMVDSDAVVQRSALRNFLMRSFHLVLTILTPPATSRIGDTQCGFKLFSRATLPHIIPYMHTEGWIFDIEMLMLAESAPDSPILGAEGQVIGHCPGIKVAEVPIQWHEVGGSKMSLLRDSVSMAFGLAVLRASWMVGVYRRRAT